MPAGLIQQNPQTQLNGQLQQVTAVISQPTTIKAIDDLDLSWVDALSPQGVFNTIGRPTNSLAANFFDDALLHSITTFNLLKAEVNQIFNEFKSSQYNHLKISEITQYLASQVTHSNIENILNTAPTTFDYDAIDTFVTAYNQAVATLTQTIHNHFVTTSGYTFSLWASDINNVISTLIDPLFSPAPGSIFEKYHWTQPEINLLPTATTIRNQMIESINTIVRAEAASATPDWTHISNHAPFTLSAQNLADLERAIVIIIENRFDAAVRMLSTLPTALPLTSDEYHELLTASHDLTRQTNIDKIFTVIDKPYDNVAPLKDIYTKFITSPYTTYWDPALFDIAINVGQLSSPQPDGTQTATVDFVLTPKFDPTLVMSRQITLKVDSRTKVMQAKADLTALIKALDMALDTSSANFNPDANGIQDLDDVYTNWDSTLVGYKDNPTQTRILNGLATLMTKYENQVGFAWSFKQHSDGKWFIVAELTDINPEHGSAVDAPATFEVEVRTLSPSDKIREFLRNNKNNLFTQNVYQSEFEPGDDLSQLETRILNDELVAQINALVPGIVWDFKTNSKIIIVTDTTTGKIKPVLEVILPDGSLTSVDLPISGFYSPSANAQNDIKSGSSLYSPHGVIDPNHPVDPNDPNSNPVYISFNEGDTLTPQQLEENYPAIFAQGAKIIEEYKTFGLTITSNGQVHLKVDGRNEYLVIDLVISDSTTDQSVTHSIKVNINIATQEDIDQALEDMINLYQVLDLSVDQWDGDPQIKQQVKDQLKAKLEEFKTLVPSLLGKTTTALQQLTDRFSAEMTKLLGDQNIPIIEQPNIPKHMTLISKILLLTSSSLAAIGGVAALVNAGTIATTNNKLKKSDSTMRVKARKTGILSLIIAVLLITISVGMFVYLFVNQGGL